MDAKTLELAVVGIVSFWAGISKDIVLEYLKLRPKREEQPRQKCVEHELKMMLFEQRLSQHDKDLKDGKATFEEMRQTLSDIKESVAVLVDRSKKHRQGD